MDWYDFSLLVLYFFIKYLFSDDFSRCVSLLGSQIVLVAVQDNAWDHYGTLGYFVMLSLGAKEPGLGRHSSYTLIGYKGKSKPIWVKDYGRPVTRGPTVLRETIPYSDSP